MLLEDEMSHRKIDLFGEDIPWFCVDSRNNLALLMSNCIGTIPLKTASEIDTIKLCWLNIASLITRNLSTSQSEISDCHARFQSLGFYVFDADSPACYVKCRSPLHPRSLQDMHSTFVTLATAIPIASFAECEEFNVTQYLECL